MGPTVKATLPSSHFECSFEFVLVRLGRRPALVAFASTNNRTHPRCRMLSRTLQVCKTPGSACRRKWREIAEVLRRYAQPPGGGGGPDRRGDSRQDIPTIARGGHRGGDLAWKSVVYGKR